MARQIAMVDYTKCQPEKCDKGICLAVLACPNKILKTGAADRRWEGCSKRLVSVAQGQEAPKEADGRFPGARHGSQEVTPS
jgi:hypothetical protein